MISYVILRVRTQSMCVQWMKNPLVWKYRARLCYNSHKKPMDNHSRSCAFFLALFFVQSFHIRTAVCITEKSCLIYWILANKKEQYIYWENIKCEATSLHLKCSLFIMRFVDLFAAVNHFSNTTQTIECIDSVLNFDLSTTFRFGHILEPLSLILDEISKHTHTHAHQFNSRRLPRAINTTYAKMCIKHFLLCGAKFYLLKNSIVWIFLFRRENKKLTWEKTHTFFP